MSRKHYEEILKANKAGLDSILSGILCGEARIDLVDYIGKGQMIKGTLDDFDGPDCSDAAIAELNKLGKAKDKESLAKYRAGINALCNKSITLYLTSEDSVYKVYTNLTLENCDRVLWTLNALFRELGASGVRRTVSKLDAMRWVMDTLQSGIGKTITVFAYPNGDYVNYAFGAQAEAKFAELSEAEEEEKPNKSKKSSKDRSNIA